MSTLRQIQSADDRGTVLMIRPWRPGDKLRLERLSDQLSRQALATRFHGGATRIPADYLQSIDELWPARWNAAVALRDDVLIGWSEYQLDRDDPLRAEVGVCVADVEQGRGLGTVLVRAVVDLCAARGVTTVQLQVGDDNLAAQRLYEKLTMRNGESAEATRPMTYLVDVEPRGFHLSAS